MGDENDKIQKPDLDELGSRGNNGKLNEGFNKANNFPTFQIPEPPVTTPSQPTTPSPAPAKNEE